MRKRIDLTGQKFGRLLVLGIDHKDKYIFWKCKCECGNITIIPTSSLLSGDTSSCGCYNKEQVHKSNFKDLAGQKFGKLEVIEFSHRDNHRNSYWKCKCDCGNETIVNGTKLKSGHTKSCGCLQKVRKSQIKDLTGQKFGRLTVLELAYYKKGSFWKCKCECGNTTIANGTKLKIGEIKSCGCLVKELNHQRLVDLTGKRFGKLTAISYNMELGKWHCKCDCGNEIDIVSSSLVGGRTQSCGCLSISYNGSKGENEIKEYITKLLPNAIISKERILEGKEIDIYLPEYKVGIEYNGSAFHASENAIYKNKDKYYHRDKFLAAKEKGIHLITVFDFDYEKHKWQILERIRHILLGKDKKFFIPDNYIVYTDNDYDNGLWLLSYGYKEAGQIEPDSVEYKGFTIYRCGKTKWLLN